MEHHLSSPSAPQWYEHPAGAPGKLPCVTGLNLWGMHCPWGLLLWWEQQQEQEHQYLLGEIWLLGGSKESAYRKAVVKMPVPVLQERQREQEGTKCWIRFSLQWNYPFKISYKGDVSSRRKQLAALILQGNNKFRWHWTLFLYKTLPEIFPFLFQSENAF